MQGIRDHLEMKGEYVRTRVDVLNVGIDALNLTSAVARVEGWIARRTPSYAIFRDVHGVMLCQADKGLLEIHRNAGMVSPDGMPLVWLARAHADSSVSRVYGPDFLVLFCRTTAGKGYRHYFYGATPETVNKLIASLRLIDPGLIVAGTNSPPFRPLTHEEDLAVIEDIDRSQADIVWVGLSTPKQERWMAAHQGRISAPAMLGIGAAFDFISGNKPQAPAWMQRRGLEWLYRLATEPRRLGLRYARTLPAFAFLVAAQFCGLRRPNE